MAALVDADHLRLVATSNIEDLAIHVEPCSVIAIDMPIALVESGRRSAESELRAVLGSSARSVFTSPCRAALAAPSQAEATIVNRAHGGPGISAQAFGLFGPIQELRDHLAHRPDPRWYETHPETSFALMNDGTPLASKRSAVGVAQRLCLARTQFPTLEAALCDGPQRVPIDDALDAVAAAWSALRIADGTAAIFGPNKRDDQQLPLAVFI